MGFDAEITMDGILTDAYERKSLGEHKVYFPKTEGEQTKVQKLLIPEFYGGRHICSSGDSLRAKEVRAEDLQAGDILIWQVDSTTQPMVAVHDGENLVLAADGQLRDLLQ